LISLFEEALGSLGKENGVKKHLKDSIWKHQKILEPDFGGSSFNINFLLKPVPNNHGYLKKEFYCKLN
jgi:hypothetical protein